MSFPSFLSGNKVSQKKKIDAINVTILLKTIWVQKKKLPILFNN